MVATLVINLRSEAVLEQKYSFLANRIFLDNPKDKIISFVQLRQQLREYVASKPEKIGIYFEYLFTGVAVGVNDREEFFSASLIKLPVVMRAYKLIEEGKLAKSDVMPVTRDNVDQGYGDLWKSGRASITVSEAIELILTQSDNTAFQVLNSEVAYRLDKEQVDRSRPLVNVYDYLDIPVTENSQSQFVSPKNYSSILKSLYFSAYLNIDASNEILNTLAKSEFVDWIPAKLPKNVRVAHKTGTYISVEVAKHVQSDCGIVYASKRTYILCIMIKTDDAEVAKQHVNEISKQVYDFVTNAN